MYLERHGAGPRIFFGLHGWSGDHHTFDPLLPHLPADATLYAPDLPGCGATPPPRSWCLEEVAGELVGLVSELARPSLVLIGNCSGALLGLATAMRLLASGEISRLERLVLIDPFAYWPWYFRVFVSESIGHYAFAVAFGNPVGRWVVNAALAANRRPETDLTEGFTARSAGVARAYLRLLAEIRGPEQFAPLRLPIDILHGERTFGAVRRSAQIFAGIWPQARVRVVAQAGHLPILESPEIVARYAFGGSEPVEAGAPSTAPGGAG
jgi:pimeloyl-ACP methyl ester carboxylesterase